jgi:hypothetical protein
MISYEPAESRFFVANKQYCETIENKLRTINVECSGFCDSYGYDLISELKTNNVTYNLRFQKYEEKIPPNRIAFYSGIEVTVTGLNNKINTTIVKNKFKRLFTSNEYKEKFPSPYSITPRHSLDNLFTYQLVSTILNNEISKFELNNGTLKCLIHTPLSDPLKLIEDLENSIKNWT